MGILVGSTSSKFRLDKAKLAPALAALKKLFAALTYPEEHAHDPDGVAAARDLRRALGCVGLRLELDGDGAGAGLDYAGDKLPGPIENLHTVLKSISPFVRPGCWFEIEYGDDVCTMTFHGKALDYRYTQRERSEALVERAREKLRAGDAAGAMRCFDEALAEDPSKARWWSDLPVALARVGRFKEAKARAAKLSGNPAEAWTAIAVSAEAAGEHKLAVEVARRRLRGKPDFYQEAPLLGAATRALLALGQPARALELIAKRGGARAEIECPVLHALGRHEQVVARANEALKRKPMQPAALLAWRGRALVALGKGKDGRASLEKAAAKARDAGDELLVAALTAELAASPPARRSR